MMCKWAMRSNQPEQEAAVCVASHLLVGLHDVANAKRDEVVEGVNVLPHKTTDLQKRGKQLPFVLYTTAIVSCGGWMSHGAKIQHLYGLDGPCHLRGRDGLTSP